MTRDEELIASLRRGYEAYNRGDFERATADWAPDIEVRRTGGLGELSGFEAARKWLEPEAFEWQRVEPRGYTVNGDLVLVDIVVSGRGKGSGIEVAQEAFQVWTFDDEGRTQRMEIFFDRDEALAAAGLA